MSNSPVNIAVIGTVNKDLILPYEGASIQSIGGIYYSMAALSQLGGEEVRIHPVSFIGADLYVPFLSLIRRYSNIITDDFLQIDQKNHEVLLEYASQNERMERAFFNFPPLDIPHISKFNDHDFYIINMITGWDISLEAYRHLSKRFYDKMLIDIHFLVMGTDKTGKRYPKRPEDIEHWISGSRFVQMNEREYRIIAGENTHDVAFYEKYFSRNQVLIITLGMEGALIMFHKDGIVRRKLFPSVRLEKIADATGCGDVFGAAFVWKYLSSQNLYQSMEYANLAAGANCLLKGTNEISRLPALIAELSGAA